MNVFKLTVGSLESFTLTTDVYETKTRESYPFYQTNEQGQVMHYAVCPACENPIQIINLYKRSSNSPGIYGKHCSKSINGVAKFDYEEFQECKLAAPRGKLAKSSRRKALTASGRRILYILENYFDQIAYLFEKVTGVGMSSGLAKSMFEKYLGESGYLYKGASVLNVPWIFAYMADGQNLFGRIIKGKELRKALEQVPGVQFSQNGQLGSNTFIQPVFWFSKHRQILKDHKFTETLTFTVSFRGERPEGWEDVYEKKITFDFEYFQALMRMPDEKRPYKVKWCKIAQEALQGI